MFFLAMLCITFVQTRGQVGLIRLADEMGPV